MAWVRNNEKVDRSDGVQAIAPDGETGTAHRRSDLGSHRRADATSRRDGPVIEEVIIAIQTHGRG